MKLGLEDARYILEHTISEETAAQCEAVNDMLDAQQNAEFYEGYLTAMALVISFLCVADTKKEHDQALAFFAVLGKRACTLCL